jgi:type IV pilus assembly protein PilF
MNRVLIVPILLLSLSGCVKTEIGGVQAAPAAQRLQAQLDLARGYLEMGDAQSARRPLERALRIDPHSSEAHVLLATAYLADGDKQLAEREYRTALRDDPHNSMARNNYGTFLFAEGRYKDAKKELERAADDPDYGRRAQAFENLGLTELKLDETDAAKESFQRALLLNTSMPRSYLELAHIDFSAGNFPAAKENFDRYNAIAKPTARSLWLGIRLSRVLHDQDQLASYALALRNLFPDSEEYRLYRDRQW